MVVLQILNKILNSADISIATENNLTEDMFIEYQDEYKYIYEFYKKYGKVPDKETFLSQYPEFNLIEVTESNDYLLDKLNEEYLYSKTVPVVQNVANLLKTNSEEAVMYLMKEIPNLTNLTRTGGIDIITRAEDRFEEYHKKLENKATQYITTGFEELDSIFKGFSRGEELVVLFARIGQGKSWVLNKMLAHSWQIGYNVGLISPEMSATKIGYRFDTLVGHFSNKNLNWGQAQCGYDEDYINKLKEHPNKYIVATPQDFNRKITISKLKSFVERNKIDILGIDGITYLTDERYKNGDTRTTMLTNISEDLMSLSIELKIPIIVVVQSNRSGVNKETDDTPDLENIKDSDGIGANATKVLAIKQRTHDNVLQLSIRKHRDGRTGQTLLYQFDFDTGDFIYIPSNEDGVDKQQREERLKKIKAEFKDSSEVF